MMRTLIILASLSMALAIGQITLAPFQGAFTSAAIPVSPTNLILQWQTQEVNDASVWSTDESTWAQNATTATTGQSDPFGGTGAVLEGCGGNCNIYSLNFARTGIAPVVGTLWAKSNTGSSLTNNLAIVWDGGAEISNQSITITTSWQKFQVSATPSGSRTLARLQLGTGTSWSTGQSILLYRQPRLFVVGSLSGLTVTPPFSVITVHRPANAGAYRAVWGGPAIGNIEVRIDGSNNKMQLLKQGQYAFATESTTATTAGTWVCSGLSYSATGVYKWYTNGQPDGGPTTDLQSFTSTSSPQIGDSTQVGDTYAGYMGAGLVYSAALSDAAQLQDYKALKARLAPMIVLP
jgi:hypothetical protein